MSYDLWVWSGPMLDNARLAGEVDLEFAGSPSAFLPSPALAELVRDVQGRFPPLESLSDEQVEQSPWSVSPEVSPGLAAFLMGFRWASTACPHIVRSALRRGLRAHDPQTGTTYAPGALTDGSGEMAWDPAGWGCAAIWRWGGEASSPATRRKRRLTLGRAYAAIVADSAASFVLPMEANQLLATLSFPTARLHRPALAVESSGGALLVRYRRDDEGPVVEALGLAARQHSFNLAAPAGSAGSWYLVAG